MDYRAGGAGASSEFSRLQRWGLLPQCSKQPLDLRIQVCADLILLASRFTEARQALHFVACSHSHGIKNIMASNFLDVVSQGLKMDPSSTPLQTRQVLLPLSEPKGCAPWPQ